MLPREWWLGPAQAVTERLTPTTRSRLSIGETNRS
jgi:hypothetical protein